MKAKYQKRADGRFATNVWDGTYKNGKKHYVFLTGSSSRDLEEKVRKLEVQRETGGVLISDDITLQEYARKWLKSAKSVKEKATYAMYENIIEKRLGDLETVRVADIRHSALQEQINNLAATPRTCQLFLVTIKQVLKSAAQDHIIPKDLDLLNGLNMPTYRAKERRPLTDREKSILKDKVFIQGGTFTPKEKAFIALLFYCGIRREEALALTRFDVKDNLQINKAVGFDKNDPYLKETKSKNGVRTIPLSEQFKTVIKPYIDSLEGALLFPGTAADKYMSKSVYVKFWDRIRKKFESCIDDKFPDWNEIGIKDLTAHIFRHNFCTQLCYESLKTGSISTKKIAQLLGDTETMVLKVYGHINEKNEKPSEAVANALAL